MKVINLMFIFLILSACSSKVHVTTKDKTPPTNETPTNLTADFDTLAPLDYITRNSYTLGGNCSPDGSIITVTIETFSNQDACENGKWLIENWDLSGILDGNSTFSISITYNGESSETPIVNNISINTATSWGILGGVAFSVLRKGNTVFVATDTTIDIYDATLENDLVLINSFYEAKNSRYLKISDDGNTLFATGAYTTNIIDITYPMNPILLSTINNAGEGLEVDSTKSTLYIGNTTSVVSFNITNLNNPIPLNTNGSLTDFLDMELKDDNTLMIIDDGDIVTLNSSLSETNRFVLSNSDRFSMNATKDRMVVARYSSGVSILDITDPNDPTVLSTLTMGGDLSGTVSFNAYYMKNYITVLHVDGIAGRVSTVTYIDEANPVVEGTVNTTNQIYNVSEAVVSSSDTHLYVTHRAWPLSVITLENTPIETKTINSFVGIAQANDVLLTSDDQYAFMAENNILYVIDISDINKPVIVDQISCLTCTDIQMTSDENTIFAGADSGGLLAFDISDPTNVTAITGYGNLNSLLGVTTIAVDDVNNWTYVYDYNFSAIFPIDHTTLNSPSEDPNGSADYSYSSVSQLELTSDKNTLVLADGSNLVFIDVSNIPSAGAFSEITSYNIGGTINSFKIIENTTSGNDGVLVSYGSGLMSFVNFNDLGTPTISLFDVDGLNLGKNCKSIIYTNDFSTAYCTYSETNNENGVLTIDISDISNVVAGNDYNTYSVKANATTLNSTEDKMITVGGGNTGSWNTGGVVIRDVQ
jgi:hypothetical protein